MLDPFRIYRKLEADEHIVIFGDPAEGVDFCAAVGISKKHMDVPLVFNDRIESSQFGHDLYHIAKFVEVKTQIWPTVAVERNTGQATIYVLVSLNYPDLFRMKYFDSPGGIQSEKIGWLTTQSTRKGMLDELALVLRQGGLRVYDKEIVAQLRSFITDRKGKSRAESNMKDDLVVALAGSYSVHLKTPKKEIDDFDANEWKKEREKWRFK